MMLKIVMAVSFVLLIVAFWQRNDLQGDLQLLPQLQQEPLQTPVTIDPFDVAVNDRTYRVEPLFEYDLHGLVVSYELHDGDMGLHSRWGDHLNVADVCIVWKSNASSDYLPEWVFSNGEFTCFVKTHSSEAWDAFNMTQLSNNHLITGDDYLRGQIAKVSIGDQVRVRGWLSNYGQGSGSKRGTSTTRDDTGNGACETIYVTHFDILSSYSNAWRKLMYVALIVFLSTLVAYFRKPFVVSS